MPKAYQPDNSGLAQIGKSAALQKVVMAAAERGASFARGTAPGDYRVTPATVRAGRRNEERAGAVLENVATDALSTEGQTRVLKRSVAAIEQENR